MFNRALHTVNYSVDDPKEAKLDGMTFVLKECLHNASGRLRACAGDAFS